MPFIRWTILDKGRSHNLGSQGTNLTVFALCEGMNCRQTVQNWDGLNDRGNFGERKQRDKAELSGRITGWSGTTVNFNEAGPGCCSH